MSNIKNMKPEDELELIKFRAEQNKLWEDHWESIITRNDDIKFRKQLNRLNQNEKTNR